MTDKELFDLAITARKNSYAPYSSFYVGAALLGESGNVYLGCNIENAAFTPSNCAERTAFFKAVSEGEKTFSKIAIAAGKDTLAVTSPCGVCRQVMMEFCDPETFVIIMGSNVNNMERMLLKDLLPKGFGPSSI